MGDTRVISANTVNNIRFAFNRTTINRQNKDYFQPSDLGIKAYNYSPTKEMLVAVTGGFSIGAATSTRGIAATNTYMFSDDLTVVRGRHQIGIGGAVGRWHSLNNTWARGGGQWNFTGQASGLALADFLLGRVNTLDQSGLAGVAFYQWYQGLYAQDTWKVSKKLTVNIGLRGALIKPFHDDLGLMANFNYSKFDPAQAARDIATHKVSVMAEFAPMLGNLLDAAAPERTDTSNGLSKSPNFLPSSFSSVPTALRIDKARPPDSAMPALS